MKPKKNDVVVLTTDEFCEIGDIGVVAEYVKNVGLWGIEIGDKPVFYEHNPC